MVDQEGIVHLQIGVDAFQVNAPAALLVDYRFRGLRSRSPWPEGIPRSTRWERIAGFERLRQLTRSGNALHSGSRGDRDRIGLLLVDGVGEINGRSHARPQGVSDQLGQFQDRAPLGGRPQIAFVGDALLVETQDIADR
ncbi:MAG TPA: hypothetical protein VEP70_06785, partial [Burkholderiales bacterium]|nr:hypothetical protein [Burkholderiales bacterium]